MEKTTLDYKDKMDEIMEKLDRGLDEIFESQNYRNYLKTLSKFHHYSVNNSILISMQNPWASQVASYTTWQTLGRQVNKGEEGIKIIAPAPYKKKVLSDIVDERTGELVLDSMGAPIKEEKVVVQPGFKIATVFDISQTSGPDLPTLGVDELHGEVKDFETIKSAIEAISPVPIEYQAIESGAKGYFSQTEKKIVIQEDMDEVQIVKTLLHEIAHALLHDKEGALVEDVESDRLSRETKEVQAESIAFCVCQNLGIDTSDYSFGYVAGWSSGKDKKELKDSLDVIRKTVTQIFDGIEKELNKVQKRVLEETEAMYMKPKKALHI